MVCLVSKFAYITPASRSPYHAHRTVLMWTSPPEHVITSRCVQHRVLFKGAHFSCCYCPAVGVYCQCSTGCDYSTQVPALCPTLSPPQAPPFAPVYTSCSIHPSIPLCRHRPHLACPALRSDRTDPRIYLIPVRPPPHPRVGAALTWPVRRLVQIGQTPVHT